MTVRYLVGDVFDRLAEIPDGSVDLVVTSPPFLKLRSYLPADHPDKAKEMGAELTPAEFLDAQMLVAAALRRVLAPHGSICVELGDTYAGSGGGGGDYLAGGLREGQQQFAGSGASMRESNAAHWRAKNAWKQSAPPFRGDVARTEAQGAGAAYSGGEGWPLAKSKAMIPELYRVALAYGFNPLTGSVSPAGRWIVRQRVVWCRPNPGVGALADKWRPATSDIAIACTSRARYWDDVATRRVGDKAASSHTVPMERGETRNGEHAAGAPMLDYWVVTTSGYPDAHYAVYPPALITPLIKAMCPYRVCRTCGQPSRRIVDTEYEAHSPDTIEAQHAMPHGKAALGTTILGVDETFRYGRASRVDTTVGWTDCGHDDWRPGMVLDPYAGTGTTLEVASGHGHDAIGIDIDERNAAFALKRVGPLFLEVER